jgi:hypothetical protein
MKKVILLSLFTLVISACSINGWDNHISSNNEEFSIEKDSENFELEIEETKIDNLETESQISPNQKKFARFSDIDLWFSFLYPDNDKIIEDKNGSPIRIQNYELSQNTLNTWDFYIEIFYFDQNVACEDEISEISSTYSTNWINITRWYAIGWWDSWWTKYALCFKRWWKTIYIWYTENCSTNVNTIFNSLQIQ